ncbi:hypothetical protein [Ideonella sp.]|uniref:hypothetical protein n=1 Tax=Ideonella sp. TaxID=1929293 RepID=UPI0035B045A9
MNAGAAPLPRWAHVTPPVPSTVPPPPPPEMPPQPEQDLPMEVPQPEPSPPAGQARLH